MQETSGSTERFAIAHGSQRANMAEIHNSEIVGTIINACMDFSSKRCLVRFIVGLKSKFERSNPCGRTLADSGCEKSWLAQLTGNAKKIQVQNGEKAATVMQCRDGFDESK